MELVTVGLITFNQETTVRSALESLLAQTYSPLEIVISDDASTDGTFRELERIVAEYNGSHAVKLHRNEINLGVGGNVNRVFEEAEGELVVLAGGDDVSDRRRVEKLVAKWSELDEVSGICSGVRVMDSDGKPIDGDNEFTEAQLALFDGEEGFLSSTQLMEMMGRGVYVSLPGCSAAWHADVYRKFGPLGKDVLFEDLAFSFRASLVRGMGVVREKLVNYRMSELSMSKLEAGFGKRGIRNLREKLGVRQRRERNFLAVYLSMMRDIEIAKDKGLITAAEAEGVAEAISVRIQESETTLNWWRLGLIQKFRSMDRAPLRSKIGRVLCLLPLKGCG